MNKERESRPKGLISMLRYIFDRRDKGKLLLLLMAIVIGSFLELMGVMVFMPFVEIIADQSTIEKTWYLRTAYEFFGFSSHRSFMVAFSGGIIAVYLIKNIYLVLEKSYIFKFSYNTQMKLSIIHLL